MAIHAIDRAMRTPEREPRHRMAERRDLPEILAVTFLAMRQSSAVNIVFGMASKTLLTETAELAPLLMALGTVQAVVHAGEREIFVEVFGDLPIALGMALLAVVAKAAFVRILVTIRAGFGERLVADNR